MKSKLALLNVEVEEAWKAKEHVRVASEFLVSLKVRVCTFPPTSDDVHPTPPYVADTC